MKKILLLLPILMIFTGCGIQSIPRTKNTVDMKLAKLQNQYKRRADLIPSLVEVVKGYASHEKETLQAVIAARASATQMKIDPSNTSPEQLQAFQKNQGALSSALGRLMVVAERYPDLKANQNFKDLQVQLEGTENRITYARDQYIESIKVFNDLVTVIPTSITNSLFFNHNPMPQWDVDADEKERVKKAPKIKF